MAQKNSHPVCSYKWHQIPLSDKKQTTNQQTKKTPNLVLLELQIYFFLALNILNLIAVSVCLALSNLQDNLLCDLHFVSWTR